MNDIEKFMKLIANSLHDAITELRNLSKKEEVIEGVVKDE